MKRQQLVKVIITMMTLMCSTLSWGQEQEEENSNLWFGRYLLQFYSDSIHESSRVDFNRIYSDVIIDLSPDSYHYIQITDKPVYLFLYDTQTDDLQMLYAYSYFGSDDYPNGYGYWSPTTSPLCNEVGKKDGWWHSIKTDEYDFKTHQWVYRRYWDVPQTTQPLEFQWWTLDNLKEGTNYRSFKMEPGLYYVKVYYDNSNNFDSFVITMGKLGNLTDIRPAAFPRITSEVQEKKETVNVNNMYDYYTVTGSTRYVWRTKDQYLFTEDCIIQDGEYKGYYCKTIGSGGRFYIQPPASLRSGYYKIAPNPVIDKWYELTPTTESGDYFTRPAGQVYVIWDVNGERVKFISEETYEKEILPHMSATSISTPTITPYAPDTYFNLQGVAVENPIPGQIYIHNGKKILYKK